MAIRFTNSVNRSHASGCSSISSSRCANFLSRGFMTVALRDRSIPPTMMPYIWSAVGAIVVSWALVEQNLDILATVAFTSCGGDKIQPELPLALKNKISYLRACFRKLPALAPFTDDALTILKGAKKISTLRHFVVHGVVSHFNRSDRSLVFIRLDTVNDRTVHQMKDLQITMHNLIERGIECESLSTATRELAERITDAVMT